MIDINILGRKDASVISSPFFVTTDTTYWKGFWKLIKPDAILHLSSISYSQITSECGKQIGASRFDGTFESY